MKVTYVKPTELEKAIENLSEYETIFGTNAYTGNKNRDTEYAALKLIVKKLSA